MVGQLHVLLLLMNFRQKKNLFTEKITMPFTCEEKGSTSAAGVLLESNHSLSNDPYLPSCFPLPPSSLPLRPSQPDKHRCPMWEWETPPPLDNIKKDPTLTQKGICILKFTSRRKGFYSLVFHLELSIFWKTSRCSRHRCDSKRVLEPRPLSVRL